MRASKFKRIVLIALCFVRIVCLGQETNIKVGEDLKISDYNLIAVKNKKLDLTKVIVVDFWATWCGPCIAALPHLETIQKKYDDKIQIVAVSDEPIGKVEKFLQKKNFMLSFFIDEQKKLFSKFAIQELPLTGIISSTGKLLWVGSSDDLDKILQVYLTRGEILFTVPTSTTSRYYTNQPLVKAEENNLYEFKISLNNNRSKYLATVKHNREAPIDIKYSATPVTEVVEDLLPDGSARIINERSDLDTILIDLFAKSNSPKVSYLKASGSILITIQAMFNILIVKEVKSMPVVKLKLVNTEKLNGFREESDGGGFIKTDKDKINCTRVSLDNLASYLERKFHQIILPDAAVLGKFDMTFYKTETIDDFKKELLDNYGLAMQSGVEDIEFVTIK